jgi:predicted nucleic acid-binding protein
LVVDASAMVEWLLRTPRGTTFGPPLRASELHVPALCDVEVAAALRRALLARRLVPSRAEEALSDYRDLPLARHGHLALLPAMVAMRENFSSYDACYVALAERLDASLLTGDAGLARAVARHSSIALIGGSS